jgi:hypothetical protein
LERKVKHESNIYVGAQMPYMQRLTWSGIAMHAGDLPGYPASGGCVRLPYEFAQKVYGVMHNGATVAITQKGSPPSRSERPASVLLASRARRFTDRAVPAPDGKTVWNPGRSPSGPFSILLSYADRRVYVWRNGIQIGQAPVGIAPGARPPEGVFMMLEGIETPNPQFPGVTLRPWSVLSLGEGNPRGNAVDTIRSQVSIPDDIREKIARLLTPGTILVATRESSNASTRSGTGFEILAPDAALRSGDE